MKKLLIALCCLPLVGCGWLAPDHTQLALETIDRMLLQSVITPEQAEALKQALLTTAGPEWWVSLLQVVLEVGLAVAGVRIWRGPAATAAERIARAAAKK
jgi:hypothetical protein